MPTYVGFSTAYACATPAQIATLPAGIAQSSNLQAQAIPTTGFTLTDQALVLQDLVNAFQIQLGQKVGRPSYGTSLWGFIFEPYTNDLQSQIIAEVQRVVQQDPRIVLNSVTVNPQLNGLNLQLEVAFRPFNDATIATLFFNQATQNITLLS
jgi:phage baseplate assembly protein W